ncbi:luciferase-type oxidoreductase [Aquimarina sp. MAR_2010_214]|uniref:LLM class oxidoreductase n=1 Tax=Aquimarina sp. MAR_2010_214 TaxID=1250026 RepID=UPI000C711C73|nr:LLM class oxidoreductase [Aquimarina sp. MAR_2010_214]PKV48235.1 luciferase-type oxidoreductase [Aquimarina sp. MAR_2010_214]
MENFESINRGYNNVFKTRQLSIGLVVPVENYAQGAIPTMKDHIERVQKAEELGFQAVWLRDIPFNVPSFGDAGQTFDPFTYLGYLAGKTTDIALGVASIALPLRHPVHIAKSAATIDQLSNGRLILGVASGDRYDEYPAMHINYEKRGELFRESFAYIREAQNDFPNLETIHYGNLKGTIDVLPKPTTHKIPLLMTGYSQQTLEWNVQNTDGWMSYPKDLYRQQNTIAQWRELITETQKYNKPFMQPLYIDLQKNDDFKPQPISLGFRTGANYLIEHLNQLQDIGVNHVALNLRFNSMNINDTLECLANKVL